MIDDVRIESDEDGWHLILTGELVEGYTHLNLRLSDEAAAALVRQAEPIRDHLAEGEAVRQEYEAAGRVSYDEAHREPDDPAETLRAHGDHLRKSEKENSPC